MQSTPPEQPGTADPNRRLFVCYLPSLDWRMLDPEVTPNVCALCEQFGSVRLHSLPTTEQLPTLVTGTLPETHRVWQVSLRDPPAAGWPTRLADRLPDIATTTWQCARYAMDRSRDLPAVPAWRRRRLHQHRVKYTRRGKDGRAVLNRLGEAESVFGLLGAAADYRLTHTLAQMHALAPRFPNGQFALQMLEFYGPDLFTHWHLDNPEAMQAMLRETDALVGAMAQRAADLGVVFALLVDHGQERVTGTIDLAGELEALGLPRDSYTHFTEIATARFWFHSEEAERRIRAMLSGLEGVEVVDREGMSAHRVCFIDDRFGSVFVYTDPGRIFFPHDFYQPVGNRYIAWKSLEQRPRRHDPRHRGSHGHLPGHPSETGYLVVADDGWAPSSAWGHTADVAPTLMQYLGLPIPQAMVGEPLLSPASSAHATEP